MRFNSFAPAMAGLIGVSQALIPGLTGDLDLAPAVFDLASSWDNEVLFKGVAGIATETDAAINLGLNIKEAQIEGKINLEALKDFAKDSTLRLDLAGLKAYFEVDISASAAVYETVQLVASPGLEIDAGLIELGLEAAFALDLVVGVGAAIDLSAGFYVSFAEGDYIDLSVITKEIVGSSLDGLLAKALPIGVAAHVDLSTQIEVQLGLRLRSHVSIKADIELLGLEILEAGAEVAIWADLVEYAIGLVETDNCAVKVQNEFSLSAGVAVNVGIELLDILDISLAPEVNVKLAQASKDKVCLNGRGDVGSFLLPAEEEEEETAPVVTSAALADGLVTSTISNTKTYTITSCHVSVPNCPASETQVIVTSTVESTVTVCPASSATPTPTSATSTHKPVHTITETLTTVVPCEPTSSTYVPPTVSKPPPAPTVTITGTTSICPTDVPTDGPSDTPAPTGVPSVSVPEPTYGQSEPPVTVEPPVSTPVPTYGQPEPSVSVEPPVSVPVPTYGQPEPPVTVEPSVPVEVPTTAATVTPVPTTGFPVPIPTYTAPNSTWVSIPTPPASTWVPPTHTPAPSEPPTAGAGALKVGLAMVLPAVAALLL